MPDDPSLIFPKAEENAVFMAVSIDPEEFKSLMPGDTVYYVGDPANALVSRVGVLHPAGTYVDPQQSPVPPEFISAMSGMRGIFIKTGSVSPDSRFQASSGTIQ